MVLALEVRNTLEMVYQAQATTMSLGDWVDQPMESDLAADQMLNLIRHLDLANINCLYM